ncbi:hypothetical protein [Kitasatospora sp. NBC_01539]|uniref:hypothetical protein n=1 Tax=Kitasatospora sp. NBC_01539 TaxID=2903577 RepID=UPI0038602AE8
MYSYDVAPTTRPSAALTIPGMRPAYDAGRPTSPTPIYDSLYSEYRRLFRALPGDRTDEEQLRLPVFGGYGYAGSAGAAPYPQHQAFETFPGHAQGMPQFISESRTTGEAHIDAHGDAHGDADGGAFAEASGRLQHVEHQQGRVAAAQASGGGQGWVAAGYLGSGRAEAGGPGAGAAEAVVGGRLPVGADVVTAGGRHRSVLQLPPGRSGEQR